MLRGRARGGEGDPGRTELIAAARAGALLVLLLTSACGLMFEGKTETPDDVIVVRRGVTHAYELQIKYHVQGRGGRVHAPFDMTARSLSRAPPVATCSSDPMPRSSSTWTSRTGSGTRVTTRSGRTYRFNGTYKLVRR